MKSTRRNRARLALLALTFALFCITFGLPARAETPVLLPSARVASTESSLSFPISAVAAPYAVNTTVPLFEKADANSAVLMEYYSGARLTALRPAANGFFMVQAGEKGASVMGYMRETDIRLGAAAQREVPLSYMELQFNREAPIYAYCDAGAPVIGTCTAVNTYYAMSRSDSQWVQLMAPPMTHAWDQEGRQVAGFVFMETGLGRGYFHQPYDDRINDMCVDPLPGEWTRAQAIEEAMAQLILARDEQSENYVYETGKDPAAQQFFYESSLRQMQSRADLVYYDKNSYEFSLRWHVYFYDAARENLMRVLLYEPSRRSDLYVNFVFVHGGDDDSGNGNYVR